jgi:hypothetical protein
MVPIVLNNNLFVVATVGGDPNGLVRASHP